MYKSILRLIYRWMEKINTYTDSALLRLREQLYFMDYEDRDSDIYVVTFAKSGTTWMQVILYNLLTDGDMSFDHIYDVSPWPKFAARSGESVEKVNRLPSPRIIKSHDNYDYFDSGCKGKFIYVYRDGKDVAVSLFYHIKNYKNSDITFDQNFEDSFVTEDPVDNWFEFSRAWLQNKNHFNILYISYEQLMYDFDQTLQKIAAFVNIELTDAIVQRVKEHASFTYMKDHEDKFGEKPTIHHKLIYNQFIRKGKTGEGQNYLSESQKEYYDRQYKLLVEPYLKTIL